MLSSAQLNLLNSAQLNLLDLLNSAQLTRSGCCGTCGVQGGGLEAVSECTW